MTPPDVYRRYVSQRRAFDPAGFAVAATPRFTRLTPLAPGLDGFVTFTALDAIDADPTISAERAYFAGLGRGFEWKVYDFDTPHDLPARLARHGFTAGETEAFMVYPTASHVSKPLRPAVRVERLTSATQLAAVVALQEHIWQQSMPWLARSLADSLPTTSHYLAYAHDTLVGTGWIEFPSDSDFAELHGGAVLADQRGRGFYSALFDARAAEAQRRGYAYLAVDAAPLSRPILLRRGFQFICETTPWRQPAPSPPSAPHP